MGGELLTRLTIWITFIGYTAGSLLFAVSRSRHFDSATRIAWTVAVVGLLAHFIFAFEYFHFWSHSHAYLETARQTNEVFRVNWGGGLFINYALLVLWIVDVGWWWKGGIESYRQRSRGIVLAWHSFLIFIIFNATVVFKTGVVRWIGLLMTVLLTVAWSQAFRHRWPSSVRLVKN